MRLTDHRQQHDDQNAFLEILDYEYDDTEGRVVVRVPPDEVDTFTAHHYSEEELVYEDAFELRDLSFDPITALGRGERERLGGVSTDGSPYDDVPRDVMIALNTLGFAVVPEGGDWLDV